MYYRAVTAEGGIVIINMALVDYFEKDHQRPEVTVLYFKNNILKITLPIEIIETAFRTKGVVLS